MRKAITLAAFVLLSFAPASAEPVGDFANHADCLLYTSDAADD